jgi:hypothetical protein
MKEALRDAHAAMGDALLAGGGLSQAYAHSVQRKIDNAIAAYDAACRPPCTCGTGTGQHEPGCGQEPPAHE